MRLLAYLHTGLKWHWKMIPLHSCVLLFLVFRRHWSLKFGFVSFLFRYVEWLCFLSSILCQCIVNLYMRWRPSWIEYNNMLYCCNVCTFHLFYSFTISFFLHIFKCDYQYEVYSQFVFFMPQFFGHSSKTYLKLHWKHGCFHFSYSCMFTQKTQTQLLRNLYNVLYCTWVIW